MIVRRKKNENDKLLVIDLIQLLFFFQSNVIEQTYNQDHFPVAIQMNDLLFFLKKFLLLFKKININTNIFTRTHSETTFIIYCPFSHQL